MPAADNASCVLVTTSTLAGSAAAALGRAVAVAGAARARLTRARPTLLLLIQPLLRPVSRCCTARGLDLTHLRRPSITCPGPKARSSASKSGATSVRTATTHVEVLTGRIQNRSRVGQRGERRRCGVCAERAGTPPEVLLDQPQFARIAIGLAGERASVER